MLELVRDLAHNKGVNLILSSHLLPDVEYTCDSGRRDGQGRGLRRRGRLTALKQPRGRVFEVRVKADGSRDVRRRLRAAGLECHETDEDVMRVFVPGDGGARQLFALAAAERRAGPSPPPERADARGRVRPRRGARTSACPIHDQSYRRYARRQGRRAGVARHREDRHPHDARRASSSSSCWPSSWMPFVVRAVQIYVAANFSAGRASSRRRRTRSGEFLEQQDIFVFFVTVYARRRPDRQRPARQRAADLPVEAADARRVHRRQARRSWRRSCCSSRWCRRSCCSSCRSCSRATSTFLQANAVPVPGDHRVSPPSRSRWSRRRCWRCRRCRRAAATSASSTRALIFFSQARVRRAALHHRQHPRCRGCRSAPTSRRSATSSSGCRRATRRPWPVSLLLVVVLIAASAFVLERRVRGVEVVA